MSINYQELVPEKALGKEISRHIFQSYRAKTGLPQEIGLRYFNIAGAGRGSKAAIQPLSHRSRCSQSVNIIYNEKAIDTSLTNTWTSPSRSTTQ